MQVEKIATIAALADGEEIRIKSEKGKLGIYRLTPGIRDVARGMVYVYEGRNKTFNEGELHKAVTELIKELGIPANIKGYSYIRTAIELVMKNHSVDILVTKDIYPEIAKGYKTTSTKVERAIRHAIEISWNRGSFEKIKEIFGCLVNRDKGKPTNREYIAAIVDYIRTENF